MPGIKKLIFVDANILLDFYRARTEAGLSLLEHLEHIQDRVITSFQLEMEFKKNRQAAILEGLNELRPQQGMSRPGLFSDAKAVKAISAGQKSAEKRIKQLRARYVKAFQDPAKHDPVYKVCQRLFHKGDPLVLKITDPKRHGIRRKAMRRFMLGCPPRKKNDTSLGDAINWEWMIACALSNNAELVIVTRDSDYGVTLDSQCFVNDHLKQEFSERVSRKRKILLYTKLFEALKHFQIPITAKEEAEEEAIVQQPRDAGTSALINTLAAAGGGEARILDEHLREAIKKLREAQNRQMNAVELAAQAFASGQVQIRRAGAPLNADFIGGIEDAAASSDAAAAASGSASNPDGTNS